jgi:ElaB/YqjD/DUF883 family membrane-anchored ribosome-binding protein
MNMATLSPSDATRTASNYADKAKSAINSSLASFDQSTVDQIVHLKDETMDRAADMYNQSQKYVRKNPFYFIGGAAILGCVAGLLLSRKN